MKKYEPKVAVRSVKRATSSLIEEAKSNGILGSEQTIDIAIGQATRLLKETKDELWKKVLSELKNMKSISNIVRINAPKFRVGRTILNEYEVRRLMVDVARGDRPENIIIVRDEAGESATIGIDGHLTGSLKGMNILHDLRADLAQAHKEKYKAKLKKQGA